jgi:hypothetical protein
MKRFNENPTRAGRALQIYLILTGYARRRQVLTYGELGRLIGYTHVGVIGRFLGPIMAYCEREGIPALTAIVVNEQTGKPGSASIRATKRRPSCRTKPSTSIGLPSTRPRKPSYRRAPAASI